MVNPLRTWTIVFDTAFTNQLDQQQQYREACYNFKVAMTTAGWTVLRSSDGTTAGAGDNWSGPSSIVFSDTGAAPRSWATFAPPSGWVGVGDTVRVLFDCNNVAPDTTPQQMQVFVANNDYSAAAGGSDGSNTAPPTVAGAALETTALVSGDAIIPWTTVQTGRWTSWASSRGDVMFGVKLQGTLQWRYLSILSSNVDGNGGGQGAYRWFLFGRDSASAEVATAANLSSTTNWRGFDAGASFVDSPDAQSTCWAIANWTNGLNFNGETITSPIDVLQDIATRGRALGSLVDLWAVPTSLTAGTLDDSETMQTQRRVTIGDVMFFLPTASLPFA